MKVDHASQNAYQQHNTVLVDTLNTFFVIKISMYGRKSTHEKGSYCFLYHIIRLSS